jgi:hypothetical protein
MRSRMKVLLLGIPTISLIIFYVLFLTFPDWFPR